MNTRNLVLLSLLVGIGTVLHAMVPPILFGMKPDMLLSMMFLGILLIPKVKYVVLLSILTGIVSALTTGVPVGQIANVIAKQITALILLGLLLLMDNKTQQTMNAPILSAIEPMISGSVFLMVALFILGLMAGGFLTHFKAIVLPA